MSNQRFPRTKYVRALVRMENELEGWIQWFEGEGQHGRPADERDAFDSKARQLKVLARDIHLVADDMGRMPIRMRQLQERARDPYRG